MKKTFSRFYIGLVLFFLYAPIAIMILFSFNEPGRKGRVIFEFSGFSLENYKTLFEDEQLINSLINTLLIALIASFCAAILGTLAAIGISNLRNKHFRSTVMSVSNLPIINPEIVTGVSLMLLFIAVGIDLGAFTVVIAHILFNTPYVILNVLPRIRRMDPSLYEAALDLGCKPGKAFRKVVFPEIFPGIFAGFLMAFTFSIDDFVISYFTGGKFQTLSVFINNSINKGIKAKMLSLTGILFIVVLAVLILMNIKDIKSESKNKGVN